MRQVCYKIISSVEINEHREGRKEMKEGMKFAIQEAMIIFSNIYMCMKRPFSGAGNLNLSSKLKIS